MPPDRLSLWSVFWKSKATQRQKKIFKVRFGIVWHGSDPVCFASMRAYATLVKSS
jgi:hypothetical protein